MQRIGHLSKLLALPLLLSIALTGCSILQQLGFAPPDTPSGLSVDNATVSSLDVSWVASTGVTSYQVFRAGSASGPWTTQAYAGNGTVFTDKNLTASTVYYYVVEATNSAGTSPQSHAVQGTTAAGQSASLSSNAQLSDAVITDDLSTTWNLSPSFGPTVNSYTVTEPTIGHNPTLSLTLVDPTATVTSVTEVDNVVTTYELGSGTGPFALVLGSASNVITIVVTAQDGSTNTYTITAVPNLG